MRFEVIFAAAHAHAHTHGRRWTLPVIHASTSLLRHTIRHALTSLHLLLRLLIVRLCSVALDHADVVGLERIVVASIASKAYSTWACHDGLIHHHAIVGILESTQVLQIFHLTLKHRQVVCEHLPIELLADILLSLVLLILLLPCIVDVAVKENKLVPLFQVLADVIHVLLSDLQEVLTTREVVKHDDATDLVEELLLEVLALVKQLLYLLGSLRKHQMFRLLVIISDLIELLD
jgi:hypothetical protein